MLTDQGIDASSLCPLAIPKGRSFAVQIPGKTALETWGKLHSIAEETGMSPVVLGGEPILQRLIEGKSTDGKTADPEIIVETSLNIPLPQWFLRRNVPGAELPVQDWPDEPPAAPQTQLMAIMDPQTLSPVEKVWLALLPTPASWELPAYLQFGGGGKCPDPAEHVAIWRRWQALYGAEVVAVTGDTLEARVTRPPDNRPAALRLAREHCIYCRELLASGVQSVESLAAYLLISPIWAFWWN